MSGKQGASSALNATAILALGQLGGQLLSFLRNMLLARHLAKADYGLAAAFALSMAMLELVGRMALGVQVVQASNGNHPSFQKNAQAFQFVAGLLGCILLALASGTLANLFDVPEKTWAFGLLAIVPLCLGLEHLDIYRFQRELSFRPRVICLFFPQLVATLVTWPLVVWFGDYRVVLWLIIGKAVMTMMLTHLLAERSYRFGWNGAIVRQVVAFSWPMMINGLLLFASQQADQLIIGSQYSMAQLASYALPVSIVMVPLMLFSKSVTPVMMSILAKVQEDCSTFRVKCQLAVVLSATATVMVTVPLIISGEQVVVAFFGHKYENTGTLMAIIATAGAFRLLRIAPTTAAMAAGDTKNVMWANVVRSLGVLLVLFVAKNGLPITWVATAAVVAEICALTVSSLLMCSRYEFPIRAMFKPGIFMMACIASAWGFLTRGSASWSLLVSGGVSFLVAVVALGLSWLLFADLRQQARSQWCLLLRGKKNP